MPFTYLERLMLKHQLDLLSVMNESGPYACGGNARIMAACFNCEYDFINDTKKDLSEEERFFVYEVFEVHDAVRVIFAKLQDDDPTLEMRSILRYRRMLAMWNVFQRARDLNAAEMRAVIEAGRRDEERTGQRR